MTPTEKPRSSARRQPLGLDLGGLALHLLRLLDQRADDEGLAALAQLRADELVGAGAVVLVDQARLDRLRPAGSSCSAVVSRSP